MKRFLWLTYLCCASAFALAACGDDDGGGGSGEDGGVSPTDLRQVNDRIDGVDDALTDVAGDLDDLSGNVGDLSGEVDGLGADVEDLDSRVGDLENPDPISCSEVDQCIPDGIMRVSTAIQDIVGRLCELEINCCDEDELNYKFGPGIASVAECTETFVDLVNNGFTPSFLYNNAVIIQTVVSMAQALNDPRVRLEVDEAQLEACLEWLDARECNQYTAAPGALDHCSPWEAMEYPCDPYRMLNGLQEEGELCGVTDFDECGEDLACRDGLGANGEGLCAPIAEAGERCSHDSECDSWMADLFCNRSTGECQERAAAGEPCAYVDPTFTQFGMNPSWFDGDGLQNGLAVAIECERGHTCDPVLRECVPLCSTGSFCQNNAQCPEDHVCNFTEIPALWNTYSLGTCRSPIADDEPCRFATECASGRCEALECQPAFQAEGAVCPIGAPGVSQVDTSCASNWCVADSPTATTGTCARLCQAQADCEATHYCDLDTNVFQDPVTFEFYSACEVKRPDTAACDGDTDANDPAAAWNSYECQSGFCNTSIAPPYTCQPKAAANGACTSGLDAECPSTQYCNVATCANFVPTDMTCVQPNDCGPGSICLAAVCRQYGESGDDCTSVPCSPYIEDLNCVAVDAMPQCHVAGAYPDGAACGGLDSLCTSTWCRLSDNTCQTPIATGQPCNTAMLALNRCAADAYCSIPLEMPGVTAGECTARGSAGQSCDPRYGGGDCLNGTSCDLRSDAYVCGTFAVPPQTLFCDGG